MALPVSPYDEHYYYYYMKFYKAQVNIMTHSVCAKPFACHKHLALVLAWSESSGSFGPLHPLNVKTLYLQLRPKDLVALQIPKEKVMQCCLPMQNSQSHKRT